MSLRYELGTSRHDDALQRKLASIGVRPWCVKSWQGLAQGEESFWRERGEIKGLIAGVALVRSPGQSGHGNGYGHSAEYRRFWGV